MEILLSARGLRKGYRTPAGEVPVLQGLDLEVAAEEMVAIFHRRRRGGGGG